MDSTELDAPEAVARASGRWWRFPLHGEHPIATDVEAVISALDPHPGTSWTSATPVAPADSVREVWAWAGMVRGGRVAVEGADGSVLELDAGDLRLLDAVGQGATVAAAAVQLGLPVDEVSLRAGRLLAAGRLRSGPATAEHAVDHAAAPPDEVVAPFAAPQLAFDELDPVDTTAALHPDDEPRSGRVPVYAVWHRHVGPLLSLGMLTAAARHHHGGELAERYEIRRPEAADSFLAEVARRPGPGIVLLSDYVWSIEANLEVARRARQLNDQLVFVHGGPSCPKYEGDATRFLAEHGDVADILVRGEGEEAICDILDHLVPEAGGELRSDRSTWHELSGITFTGEDGTAVRTPDRPRISDLDALPSPYLTAEFDHIEASAWNYCLPVETTRGCPYGCTFCDWGSDTMSRIRKFDLERVTAELEWAAARGTVAINIPDANFGIMRRDVETTERVADLKRRTGYPQVLVFYPAKNTTKHLVSIMDLLGEAGISSAASLSLQTTDEATLEALDRSNISTDHFVALAADYRRRRHPLQGDLLIGIPGQTYESYRRDLQFMLDHEILVRTWPVQLLPNSPMNDPDYKAEHGIVVDDDKLVVAAKTFGEDDRRQMIRLRRVDIIAERLGLLRHVLRWLQWDHGIEATVVMDAIARTTADEPDRYPLLRWTVEYFDRVATPVIGWHAFYDEVRRFVLDELHVPASSGLDCVLALQLALMPQPGRELPATITLPHDYLAYYRSATRSLYTTGRAGRPDLPLVEHPAALFTVSGDPLSLGTDGLIPAGDPRSETMQGDFLIGSSTAHELDSPLMRLLPAVAARGLRPALFSPAEFEDLAQEASPHATRSPTLVPTPQRRSVDAAAALPEP